MIAACLAAIIVNSGMSQGALPGPLLALPLPAALLILRTRAQPIGWLLIAVGAGTASWLVVGQILPRPERRAFSAG